MRWATLLSVLLLALAIPSFAAGKGAEPKVGPLDGKQVESLPPVLTPMSTPATAVTSEKLANPALAEESEKMGNYTTAVNEWQRLAYEFSGEDRANALYRLGLAQLKLGNKAAAATALQTYLSENPQAPHGPKARYMLLEAARDTPTQPTAVSLLTSANPRTNWDEAALYTLAWAEGLATGHVTQTYGLEKATTLQTRLKILDQRNTARKATATLLGLVPGAGIAFLGRYAEGGLTLTVWSLLALAFLSACRHRHYAYAFVFVLPFAFIWTTSPGAAATLAKQLAETERKAAMPQWAALQPTPPEEETAPTPPPVAAMSMEGALNQLLETPSPSMLQASPTVLESATIPSPTLTSNE